jgi:HSP20 family molecular chaperone IbpA
MRNVIYDVDRIEGGYQVRIAVPGCTKEDVELSLVDGGIKIKTNKGMTNIDNVLSTELALDPSKMNASVQNGVLKFDLINTVNKVSIPIE